MHAPTQMRELPELNSAVGIWLFKWCAGQLICRGHVLSNDHNADEDVRLTPGHRVKLSLSSLPWKNLQHTERQQASNCSTYFCAVKNIFVLSVTDAFRLEMLNPRPTKEKTLAKYTLFECCRKNTASASERESYIPGMLMNRFQSSKTSLQITKPVRFAWSQLFKGMQFWSGGSPAMEHEFLWASPLKLQLTTQEPNIIHHDPLQWWSIIFHQSSK